MVLWLDPVEAVIGLEAVTLVCEALTAPGTVNAVNVSGEATPVAWTSCVESTGLMAVPSVQSIDAMPEPLVTDVDALTDPPPFSTDQEIVTPDTGLFSASLTITESGTGSVTPTVSVWRSPPFTAIWVAPPTWAVTANDTGVSAPTVAVVLSLPGVAPSVRFMVAWPLASVCDVPESTEP